MCMAFHILADFFNSKIVFVIFKTFKSLTDASYLMQRP